jgi:hypothetical protein
MYWTAKENNFKLELKNLTTSVKIPRKKERKNRL